MDGGARVCPFCGDPPGAGVFCERCGHNLAAVEQLPTRAEWEAQRPPPAADALAAFLAAMHAAGDPGTQKIPIAAKARPFRSAPKVEGWIVRPVDREDFEQPRRYVPGLALTVEGRFHVLDSELRGWGQRDFPRYHHTVQPEPVQPPADARLADELAAVLAANGVSAGPGT